MNIAIDNAAAMHRLFLRFRADSTERLTYLRTIYLKKCNITVCTYGRRIIFSFKFLYFDVTSSETKEKFVNRRKRRQRLGNAKSIQRVEVTVTLNSICNTKVI